MAASLANLFAALREGITPAPELARRLGVSRATLSRLIAKAGPRVLRIGATRATRYCLVRPVDDVGDAITVRRVQPDGRPVALGTLRAVGERSHLLLLQQGGELAYDGLPPWVDDMRPQGFLGRRFAERNADLQLPPRIQDWSSDHILKALALRGEDAVGDLILGDSSFDRWLASAVVEARRSQYPALAHAALRGEAGSSAGGEHPKFAALSGGRHVLVKFADRDDGGAVTRRWRDLLACEALALKVISEEGQPAAVAACVDVDGMRFLEVERFDRVGLRGRRGVVSLGAWDDELLGARHQSWSLASAAMEERGMLSAKDARAVRWFDVFGQLIANSDRHFWNVSFFWDLVGKPTLAPAYDMLPMLFAPGTTGVTDREYQPAPPTAATLDVWPEAAAAAANFWRRAAKSDQVSKGFQKLAAECGKTLEKKRAELSHLG